MFNSQKINTDPYPYQTYWPDGSRGVRYASEHAARIKAARIGGTYKYEPRS